MKLYFEITDKDVVSFKKFLEENKFLIWYAEPGFYCLDNIAPSLAGLDRTDILDGCLLMWDYDYVSKMYNNEIVARFNQDKLQRTLMDFKSLEPMIKVYIASPYTLGDVAVNVKNQMDAADTLMNLGFAPFVPLYSHFQHLMHPRPYQDWIKQDFEWISVCDCVLRLPGESKGADGEVKLADKLGLNVFFSVEALDVYYTYNKLK